MGEKPINQAEKDGQVGPTGLDAYKPEQIKILVEKVGVAKANLAFVPLITLAILAGAFIAFGAAAYTVAMTGSDLTYGPHRFFGGIVFSLGLILIVVGGAELFTGNALMIIAARDGLVARASSCEIGQLSGSEICLDLYALWRFFG